MRGRACLTAVAGLVLMWVSAVAEVGTAAGRVTIDGAPAVIAEAETPGITGLDVHWNTEQDGTAVLVIKGSPVVDLTEGKVGLRVSFEGREDKVFVPYERRL